MVSSARLVMRRRLPLRDWKYDMMVRPFCHCFFFFEVDDVVGDREIFSESPFVFGS